MNRQPPYPRNYFWLVRYRGAIFFFLIVLTLAGIYAAKQVPISVFPDTNFPRVVIGVDNERCPSSRCRSRLPSQLKTQ